MATGCGIASWKWPKLTLALRGQQSANLTDEDGEGRALQKWCEEAGCSMGLDQMGNMFAEREGTDPDALPATWAHILIPPTGGKYDGVLGVLAGLEVIRSLNDMGIKPVINRCDELPTKGHTPCSGNAGLRCFAVFTIRTGRMIADAEGKKFGDELTRIGWRGEEDVGARKMHVFELHIEQGPILEAEDVDIGAVTHGQGLSWMQVTSRGKSPRPCQCAKMGLGMARILDLVDEIALSHAPHAVGAVGHIDVYQTHAM